MTAAPSSVAELLAFAHCLADAAGAAILPRFRRRLAVDNKARTGAYDPVTAADRAAEKLMRSMIAEAWPDHDIVGEEFGDKLTGSQYCWSLDPIDGTRAFLTGLPLWGTLVGLLDGGVPLLGLMDQPFTGERFWADERAAFMRQRDDTTRRMRTKRCRRLDEAILTSTHPDLFAGVERDAFARLSARVRMTRFGGDCYGYAMLAAGFTDLVVEAGLKPYDVGALIPIIERAGGRITTWTGEPATGGGRIVAAGDAILHRAALRILATS